MISLDSLFDQLADRFEEALDLVSAADRDVRPERLAELCREASERIEAIKNDPKP